MHGIKFNKLPKENRQAILKGMLAAGTNHEGQSNREFASQNETFKNACAEAGIQPTKRQAAKYRRNLNRWA